MGTDPNGNLPDLTEDDLTPPHCATHIVNKDLSVYLQLRGGLNTEAECKKLRPCLDAKFLIAGKLCN